MKSEEIETPQEYAIGIDIGGTTTKFGIVNHRGEISNTGDIVTTKYNNINEFIDQLYEELKPAIEKVGGEKLVKGIGVGAPNGNYYSGTIEYAPNLHWRGIIPIAKLISERLTASAHAASVNWKDNSTKQDFISQCHFCHQMASC